MFEYIFLLGRPGCGKSVVYNLLTSRMREEGLGREFMRIDDYPILKELMDQDTDFKKHILVEGEFQITDLSVYDDVLEEINRRLKGLRKPDRVIFVEFARRSYVDALEKFDREVLDRSLVIYIYCPFELCLKRNKERFERGGKTVDEHIVPEDKMKEYYLHDDYEELFLRSEEELQKRAPAQIVVVRNDGEGLESLKQELEKVVRAVRAETRG